MIKSKLLISLILSSLVTVSTLAQEPTKVVPATSPPVADVTTPEVSPAKESVETAPTAAEATAIKKPKKRRIRKRLKNLYANVISSIDGVEQKPIKIKLFYKVAPKNVENFVALAEGKRKYSYKGRTFVDTPFYDGLQFHIVIKNFIIQGGDPTNTGGGGPGYFVRDEIYPTLKHDKAGIVGMASSGKHKNGSQFYITLREQKSLDKRYTIIGEVVEGLDVVKAIGEVPTNIAKSRPLKPVKIKTVKIIREFK